MKYISRDTEEEYYKKYIITDTEEEYYRHTIEIVHTISQNY